MASVAPPAPWGAQEGAPPPLASGLPPQPSIDSLMAPMQAMSLTDPAQAQSNLAAMMWHAQLSQMAANPHHPGPAMMMPPWPAPSMPMVSPMLNVRVDGLKFEYQLTEDDVRKVFSRYGEVYYVHVDREGTSATVQFENPQHAASAQHDLDHKQLAGMSGAFLRVELAQPAPFHPDLAQIAAASAAQSFAAGPLPAMHHMPGPPPTASLLQAPPPPLGGRPKKYTCKLEVGIENEGEFRVGSRVIQIARQIWQDQKFQDHGGKTRLRGKGVGGMHEADEPLALCISCRDQAAFDKAVQHAETALKKVHVDYQVFCQQKGRPVPELTVKISKRGSHQVGPRDPAWSSPNVDPPRGERPPHAPSEAEIEQLIEERNEARKAANFKRSDEVRDWLKQRGVVLMDEKGAKGNFKGCQVTKWRYWRP